MSDLKNPLLVVGVVSMCLGLGGIAITLYSGTLGTWLAPSTVLLVIGLLFWSFGRMWIGELYPQQGRI